MYHDDHNPPHFHARYGRDEAAIGIDPIQALEGRLPPRVLGLIVEWAMEHQEELQPWSASGGLAAGADRTTSLTGEKPCCTM